MADAMVLATQKWLNEKYGNDSRFNKVAEDGITGWGTMDYVEHYKLKKNYLL
mgnify:CR=1 FL=1